MIRFGLRLTIAGGREAAVRLVIIAAAMALGVGLLLTTIGGINAVDSLIGRYAWLNSGIDNAATADPATPEGDPLWLLLRESYFHGKTVGRVDVAATGANSPVPPGIPRLPGPGEFYASPALTTLLQRTPADQLGDRFGGHQVGTIGAAALPAPDSLLVIVGQRPADIADLDGARRITRFATACADCSVGIRAAGIDLILGVVAGALIFPLLMFIGTATRLSAARREQRFAAMRLVGATPRQISVLAAAEATVAAVAGMILGFGLFYLFRHQVARIPLTGAPFFPDDLSLGPLDIALVALGVPVAAALSARLALRRVQISPLGVTRRVTPVPPRAYRLIPLVLGLAELAYFLVGDVPESSTAQVGVFLPGFLVVMAGLVIAGPWLTMVGARLMARRTSRPATLIATRRLADNPKAGFRAVSGLILALFVTTVAVGVITTIVFHRGGSTDGPVATNLGQNLPEGTAAVPEPVLAELAAVPGVRAVVVMHPAPEDMPVAEHDGWTPPDLVSCAVLAAHPEFGRCEAGAEVAAAFSGLVYPDQWPGERVWPTAQISAERLAGLPASAVVVSTDGSGAARERARTLLMTAFPGAIRAPATDAEWLADNARELNQYKQLANVVIVVSLVIAGCSLAVSVVGGLTERKRPFSMLRLTGMSLPTLRRVVVLETAVPLLAAAVVAIGTGMLGAHLFLTAQMHYTLRPLGLEYVGIVVAGLAGSLGIIASTMPLLRRVTGPETARNE